MRTAAIYIRVSTDDQLEYSPDAQERLLRDYASRNDIIILNEYRFIEETGISARKADKRPKFQHMIGLAKSNEHHFDTILVWKYSRFARNQEESIVYKSLLKKNNVDVISITETVDGPFGSLIERIIEWMDEYYSIRLSEEVKRGMTEKAMRGEYQTGAPFGYISEKGKGQLIIDDEKAAIIRNIFDMYLNHGMSFFSIAQHLNEMRITTNRGNKFENRTVRYIIQNPTYKGYVRWNPNAKLDLREQKNHAVDFIIKKGSHEPIIPEEVWTAANDKLLGEYRPRYAKPDQLMSHWLGGVLRCSACQGALVSGGSSGGFQCNSYARGTCNESHYVSYRKIEKGVLAVLKEKIDNGDFDFEIVQNDLSINNNFIKASIKKLDQKAKRIKEAYINGIDSLEEYKANKERIEAERKELESQLLSSGGIKKSEKIKNIMVDRLSKVYAILNSNADKSEKNSAIKSIVKKIVYDKKSENIDIYLYYS